MSLSPNVVKTTQKYLRTMTLYSGSCAKLFLVFWPRKLYVEAKLYVMHAFMMRLVLDATSLPPIFERNDRW